MSILNYEEMTLESDTFQAARETFNLMLQKLFKKMEQSDMDEGSIDLKISIELNEDYVPQDDGTTDTDVPSGGYGSTDDSGMPLPFSEDDDYYPYDEPMEE